MGRSIPHIAESQAEGMLNVEGLGRFHEPGHLLDQGQGDGGDSHLVEHTLDQSHGLTAHRSRGDQQRQIYLVLPKFKSDLGSDLRQKPLGAGNKAHEGEMTGSGRADLP